MEASDNPVSVGKHTPAYSEKPAPHLPEEAEVLEVPDAGELDEGEPEVAFELRSQYTIPDRHWELQAGFGTYPEGHAPGVQCEA
jgi:hypothetical protein